MRNLVVAVAALVSLVGCGTLGWTVSEPFSKYTEGGDCAKSPSAASAAAGNVTSSEACLDVVASYAADTCMKEAAKFQRKKARTFDANLVEVAISAVAIGLGATNIPAAKFWGVFGGSSALSKDWANDSAATSDDDKASLELMLQIESRLGQDRGLKPPEVARATLLADAAQCVSVGAPSAATQAASAAEKAQTTTAQASRPKPAK
jgi:hypothetical protein